MKIFKKYMFIGIFIFIIFSLPITSLLKSDEMFSEIENKILAQCPKISIKDIKNGSYMKNFDKYVTDQFPARIEFIKLKNNLMRCVGFSEFKNIYIGKTGRMLEKFIINYDNIDDNIDMMNMINDFFGVETVGMFIPNSISIYEEELPFYAVTDNQKDLLNYLEKNYDGNFYTPYKTLLNNKNEYIYFNTDHHWTQLGAKLMFEDYYNKKITSKYEKVADEFLGTYYSKALINKNLADSIYSYSDFKNYNIISDETKYDSLYDESKLEGKNKYQYFMNGDPGISIIEGSGEKEILIFKDSFAHNYIPFLVNEYSKIHVLDPRYLNIDIVDYINKNKNISKIYYIYSLSTLNSSKIFTKYKNTLK